jgi:monoamine oxidase
VVGAGFTGLLASWLLERVLGDDLDLVLLEASPRMGGRIRTEPLDGTGIPYDSGAAEFYDIEGSPELRNLVDHLGLPTRSMDATPTFLFDGAVIRTEEDLERALGRAALRELASFWSRAVELRPVDAYATAGSPRDNDHPWQRMPFSEALGSLRQEDARRFTTVQVHSDLATEPSRTSALYGLDNLLVDHPAYMSMYTVPGGNEALVEALAAGLRSRRLLGAPVRSVEARKGSGCTVRFEHGGVARRLEADFVLLTLPPAQLREVSFDPRDLAAALSSHVEHHDHPTDYLRVTAAFRSAFWREEYPEDYLVSDGFGGVTVYDKSSGNGGPGAGLLSWLIAGDNATALARKGDGEVAGAALRSLPFLEGRARRELLHVVVDRWTGSLGVSRLPGGVPLRAVEERHRPSASHPGVLVAGDSLYDATICGALDSALFAAGRILGDLDGGGNGAVDLRAHRALSFLREERDRPRRRAGETLPFLTAP